jgi:hypothetical protein
MHAPGTAREVIAKSKGGWHVHGPAERTVILERNGHHEAAETETKPDIGDPPGYAACLRNFYRPPRRWLLREFLIGSILTA